MKPKKKHFYLIPVATALFMGLSTPHAHAVTCQSGLIASNPDSAYTVDDTYGTAVHTPTQLMWKRCVEGKTWEGNTCTGTASTATWAQALTQAATSNYAGYNDWRLPNIKELGSLVEECRYDPSINEVIFPNTPSSIVWSSSPSSYLILSVADTAWSSSFYYGNGYYGFSRSNDFGVRLVRSVQSMDFSPPTDINCFFDWAEARLPDLLNPSKQPTKNLLGTTVSYRDYPATGIYLGVDGDSKAVLATGNFFKWKLQDFGSLSRFLSDARAASCK